MKTIVLSTAPAAQIASRPLEIKSKFQQVLERVARAWRGDACVTARGCDGHELLVLASNRKVGEITLEVFSSSENTEIRYGDLLVARFESATAVVDDDVIRCLRKAFV